MERLAACLCSQHHASSFAGAPDGPLAGFVRFERARQTRLLAAMSAAERACVDASFEVLQFCDDVSLFVCRNQPGGNAVEEYRAGIAWRAGRVRAEWRGTREVRLAPSPLRRAVELCIPCVATRGPDAVRHVRQLAVWVR